MKNMPSRGGGGGDDNDDMIMNSHHCESGLEKFWRSLALYVGHIAFACIDIILGTQDWSSEGKSVSEAAGTLHGTATDQSVLPG